MYCLFIGFEKYSLVLYTAVQELSPDNTLISEAMKHLESMSVENTASEEYMKAAIEAEAKQIQELEQHQL